MNEISLLANKLTYPREMVLMSRQRQPEGLREQYQWRYHRLKTMACALVAGTVRRKKGIFVGLTQCWARYFKKVISYSY